MLTRIINVYLFAMIVVFTFSGNYLVASETSIKFENNVDRIFHAWKTRTANSQSIEASWRHDQENTEFWSTYQADSNVNPKTENKFSMKENAFRYETIRRNRYSYREYSGFERKYTYRGFDNAIRNRFVNTEQYYFKLFNYTKIYDSKLISELFNRKGSEYSFALINSINTKKKNPREFLIDDLIIAPFLLCFRPLEYLISKKEDFKKPLKHSKLNGNDCILLSFKRDGVSYRYWIDPSKEYNVVRMISYIKRFPCTQLDIEYSIQNQDFLIPTSWKAIVFDDKGSYPGRSQIFQYSQIDVLDCKFNIDYTDDNFVATYPDKTLIINEIQNKNYLHVNHEKTRSLEIEEVKLLASDSFSAPMRVKKPESNKKWLIMGCIIFLVLYVLIKARKTFFSRPQSTPQP